MPNATFDPPLDKQSWHLASWGPFDIIARAMEDDLTPAFYGENLYSRDVIDAFDNGQWCYVVLAVEIKHSITNTVIGEAVLGGVEWGWMGDEIGLVLPVQDTSQGDGVYDYPIPDLIDEAMADAREAIHDLIQTIRRFG